MKKILSTLILTVLVFCTVGYAGSPDPDWPDALHGEGEFMIFLHNDLRSSLYKVVVTIKKLSGTTLYTGSTYKEVNDIYLLDYPFSCTDYLTEETITFTRDSYYIQNHSQLNRYDYEAGHIGHSYDTILQYGSSSRPIMLGYGTYEISMKYYDSPYSYSNQRWYVDLKDPYYPYDTHGFPTYYDICLCVNEGNGNDYSASAYLTNKSWNAWKLIYGDTTGRLTDAFYGLRSHRLEALGLGASSFHHVPLSVYVSGPSTLIARYLSSPRSFGENRPNGGDIDLPAAHAPTATGTYTANPSCGTQQYTYQWHLKKPGWTNWIYQGSSKSVTITQTSDFYIRCTCTSGTETDTDTKFVDVIIDDDPLP